MSLAGFRHIDLPPRMACAPRFVGQRIHFETWDLSVQVGDGFLLISHGVVADARGRGLSSVIGLFKASRDANPTVLRTSAADPHLGLAPVYDAGFDSAGRRPIASIDSSIYPPEGRPGLGELGSALSLDSGVATLCESSARGKLAGKAEGLEWELTWHPNHASEVFIPTGTWPMKGPSFQASAPSPSPLVDGRVVVNGVEVALNQEPGEVVHYWGPHFPKRLAMAVCGHWSHNDLALDLLGNSTSGEPSLESSGHHDVSAGILWIRGGAWGRLGPPVPKTFGWIRVGRHLIPFNTLPDALAAASHLEWPRWESRLIGRNVKADIRIATDFDSLTQVELRDSSGQRVWRTFAADAEIELALECRVGRSWIPAGTLRSRTCRLDFGGYSPEQRVAVID